MTVTLFNNSPSVAEAIETAKLNWQAEKVALHVHALRSGRSEFEEVKSHRAIVRSDNGVQIGVVGKDYGVVQQSEGFAVVQPLIDAGIARITKAGEYDGGSVVFIEAELNTERPIEVRKGDVMKETVVFTNTHNGAASASAYYRLMRLVCLNGMTRAEKSRVFSVRHTSGVRFALDRAKAEFAAQHAKQESGAEIFRMLLTKKLSDKNLVRYVRETLSEGAGNDPEMKVRNVDRIVELAHTAPGAVPGTLFGGHAAITYWTTHERGRSADARGTGLLCGQQGALIQRATDVAVKYAEKLPSNLVEASFMASQNMATATADLNAILAKPSRI
jgi:phage/plasmid-like protein (TIGR03299 family)